MRISQQPAVTGGASVCFRHYEEREHNPQLSLVLHWSSLQLQSPNCWIQYEGKCDSKQALCVFCVTWWVVTSSLCLCSSTFSPQIFAIFAFSTCGSYSGMFKMSVECKNRSESDLGIEVEFEYPFRYVFCRSRCHKCRRNVKNTLNCRLLQTVNTHLMFVIAQVRSSFEVSFEKIRFLLD